MLGLYVLQIQSEIIPQVIKTKAEHIIDDELCLKAKRLEFSGGV